MRDTACVGDKIFSREKCDARGFGNEMNFPYIEVFKENAVNARIHAALQMK